MGPQVELILDSWGFYPAGGGSVTAKIRPSRRLTPVHLLDRGPIEQVGVVAVVSGLSRKIARRELTVINERLGLHRKSGEVVTVDKPHGPGNIVWIIARCRHVVEMFSAVGERGVPAEQVANRLCDRYEAWREAQAPVSEHLADQLLLLNAAAGGGSFKTSKPSRHTTTQAQVVERFLGVSVRIEQDTVGRWVVSGER